MRDYKLYITDIIQAIEKIQSYIYGFDFNAFKDDPKTYDSVIYNLFIIGEAANKIPDEIQNKHPEIDWRAMIGMRNIIAHGYFKIKPEIAWKTIHENLPALLTDIKKIK